MAHIIIESPDIFQQNFIGFTSASHWSSPFSFKYQVGTVLNEHTLRVSDIVTALAIAVLVAIPTLGLGFVPTFFAVLAYYKAKKIRHLYGPPIGKPHGLVNTVVTTTPPFIPTTTYVSTPKPPVVIGTSLRTPTINGHVSPGSGTWNLFRDLPKRTAISLQNTTPVFHTPPGPMSGGHAVPGSGIGDPSRNILKSSGFSSSIPSMSFGGHARPGSGIGDPSRNISKSSGFSSSIPSMSFGGKSSSGRSGGSRFLSGASRSFSTMSRHAMPGQRRR